MTFDLAFCVGVACDAAILALLRYVRALRHNGPFHAVAFFAALAGAGLMAHAAFWKSGSFRLGPTGFRDVSSFFGMWLAYGATLVPILVFLALEYADEVRRWALGERGKARRSYDQVEAALLMRDRDRAERLVRQMIEEDPKDAELHLVLGDVLLRQGDRAGADAAFGQSLALARDTEERAGLRLRMSDHLSQRGGDAAAAIEHLQRVLDEVPRTGLAEAALARIGRLRATGQSP